MPSGRSDLECLGPVQSSALTTAAAAAKTLHTIILKRCLEAMVFGVFFPL